MKKLFLPLILALFGTGAGVGAGVMLSEPEVPDPELAHAGNPCGEAEDHETPDETMHAEEEESGEEAAATTEYAKLADQFIVPVIHDEKIVAMVVVSVSVAVPIGQTDAVFAVEPRLRDGMLQVMFNHANIGGFSGNFTSTSNMRSLRTELVRSAKTVLGGTVKDVLIVDIVRQDL